MESKNVVNQNLKIRTVSNGYVVEFKGVESVFSSLKDVQLFIGGLFRIPENGAWDINIKIDLI